jgi:uncharacterized protein YaiE (UPF0345 family)
MTSAAQNSKQFLAQKGAVSTPSYAFLGNNTTGWYLSATNQITAATNGTAALTIDSSQNVGIGTSSPNSKFVVSNGGAAGLEIQPTGFSSAPVIVSYNRSGATYTQLTLDGASNVFAISGTERMRIDSSGNVGIGTSSPVTVSGRNLNIYNSSGAQATIQLQDTTTGSANSDGFQIQVNGTSSYVWNLETGPLIFGTANTERMRIDSSGNVNINTTGVSAKLYVNGNAASNIYALTDGATITPDFSLGNNFSVTLGGNRTLANPSNMTVGQSGVIYVTQDGTGSRTLSYGTYWKFSGGTAPTLTTTASATDALFYVVRTSTSITVNSLLNIG